jgi:GH15 family glucan-1,4-alpha-glucosidase
MEHHSGWFAVRCVFAFPDDGDQPTTYEERVTLWRCSEFADAFELAEADAAVYAETLDCTYVGLAQAYALADEPGHGAEVFSLMRDSDLSSDDYVEKFFATATERQQPYPAE